MGQSRSERNPRTARCARVAARYAVRGLVVAGFAGVAWLLSASAAHASSDGDVRFGSDASMPGGSLIAPVTNLVTGAGGSGLGLLDLGAGGNRHGTHSKAFTGAIGSTGGAAASGWSKHESKGDPITGAVLTVLHPVTDTVLALPRTIAGSEPRAVRSTTVNASSATNSRTKRPAKAGIKNARKTPTQEPAVQAEPVGVGSTDVVAAAATGTSGAGVDPSDVAVPRAAARLDAGATHEKPAVDRIVAQGTRHVPLLPRPAPVPAPAVGITSGAPTLSGAHHVGGAAATLPAAPAGMKVFAFRLDAVEDAELRLLTAERPTVSPD